MHIWLLLLLSGCRDKRATADPGDDTAPPNTFSGTDDTGDTAEAAVEWGTLPEGCEAPDTLAEHPLSLIGEDQHIQETPGEWFMELVDVEADLENGLVYGAGQGGLMVFDVSEITDPTLIGGYPEHTGNVGRLYRVELSDGVVYTTHRDEGLTVFDVSDPAAPSVIGYFGPAGLEGMALVGDTLYITNLFGGLFTVDVSEPDNPELLDEIDGLGTAWDIAVSGSVGYISDGQDGVVVVDLSDPDAPVLSGAVDVGGGVQDIALSGDALYAAAGGVGVVVLDVSDPLNPSITTILEYAGSVQSVAVQDDVLWAVDQEDVIAIDIGDPLVPIPLGTSMTPEFAMHVGAGDGVAWVGDWSRLEAWQADTTIRAPDLELSINTLLLDEDGDELILTVYNVGSAVLSLLGAGVEDDRLTLESSTTNIDPGESAPLRLTYSGGEDLLTTLCLASNDPDTPTLDIEVHTGSGGNHEAIGQDAPDFVLEDLAGNSWQLSEHLGMPVVLVYFATW